MAIAPVAFGGENEASNADEAPQQTTSAIAAIPEGRAPMSSADYQRLATAIATNSDKSNDKLADRSSSSQILATVDGRELSVVDSEDGSVCFAASRGDQSISGGCSQSLKSGIEPIITTAPGFDGRVATTDAYGLVAADVVAVDVVLSDGSKAKAQITNWAFWWQGGADRVDSFVVRRADGNTSTVASPAI